MITQHFLVSICDEVDYKPRSGDPIHQAITYGFQNKSLTLEKIANELNLGHIIAAQHTGGVYCKYNPPNEDAENTHLCSKGHDGQHRCADNYMAGQYLALDFDHVETSVEEILNRPIIKEYVSLHYNTFSSTPDNIHFRPMFMLDKPITNASFQEKANLALIWKTGADADQFCKDPARQFYGAKGSNPTIVGNIMPLEFVKKLVWEHDAYLKSQHSEEKSRQKPQTNLKGLPKYLEKILQTQCNRVDQAEEGNRHAKGWTSARVMGGYLAGSGTDILDEYEVERRLIEAKLAKGGNTKESQDVIRDGIAAGKLEPLYVEDSPEWSRSHSGQIDPETGESLSLDPVIEVNNCYFYQTFQLNKQSKEWEEKRRKLTNFTFEPTLFLKNKVTAYYRGVVKTETGKIYQDKELNLEAFVSVSAFNKALAIDYNLSYTGSVSDLGAVKAHMAATTPDLPQVRVEHTLGSINKAEGWLLSENQILTPTGIIDSKASGLAYDAKGFTSAKTYFDTSLNFKNQDAKNLSKEICALLSGLSDNLTFYTSAGWFFALPFKPLVTSILQPQTGSTPYWPYLFIFGAAGGGKSNLVRLYQELFGVRDAVVSVTGATPFATLQALGYSQNLPLFLDEYNRKSLENARRCDQLDTHLRDGYNLNPAYKGNKDLTSTRFERFVPAIIAGESFTEDTAIKGRCLAIDKPNALTLTQIETYKELNKLNKSAFAAIYAQWSMSQKQEFIKHLWVQATQTANNTVQEITANTSGHSELDRVASNIAVCIFGLEMLKEFGKYCGFNFKYQNYNWFVTGVLKTLLDVQGDGKMAIRVKNQADDFVEWCCNNSRRLTGSILWENTPNEQETIYIHLSTAFEIFEQERAKAHKGTFGLTSLKSQLRGRDYVTSKETQKKLAGQNKRVWSIEALTARNANLDIPLEPPPPPIIDKSNSE